MGRVPRTVLLLLVTGISLYLVFPSLLQVLSAWPQLKTLEPLWFIAMVVAEALSFVALWVLQRLALRTDDTYAVATSQLAGNAFGRIVPGGGAAAGALQYKMLVQSGTPGGTAASGLTASSLLVFAVLLALPVFALPAVIRGVVSTSNHLVIAALAGMVLFAAMFAVGAVLLSVDGTLAWVGRVVQRIRNRVWHRREPMTNLPGRLLAERDLILGVLGARWWEALLATMGRWFFDYLALVAALAAVGTTIPRPSLVLLAFVAAQLLSQIPLTPGGLGFVEAGLTGTLALAGVPGGAAVVVSLAYRLASYWLPLPAGLAAWIMHRRRYGGDTEPGDADPQPDLA
ncbi:lysylphosphatidylglycerol synthase transmembrane domain-containing protein [Capillimicrobium parvum]|uniref:Flippase-like domain-containing protein n=1 Tax=Capillimicrobium parvum TaxID=2884022 RepID=A0A9E6XUL0_9ACTN|nr:lysylphosphatidylglycerol synthase transmembrane domain-containing protein [Capillimicrobium parvum]UGS34787.1 hypothetical protein DSM104329_01169 [Capillimicrobium parvum]